MSRKVSTDTFLRVFELSMSIRDNASLSRSASRMCPERTRRVWYSTDASSQASLIMRGIRGDRAGVRALPVLKVSMARVRSATKWASLISKYLRIFSTSVSDMSSSLIRKCSMSTS